MTECTQSQLNVHGEEKDTETRIHGKRKILTILTVGHCTNVITLILDNVSLVSHSCSC